MQMITAVINSKKFPASPLLLYPSKDYSQNAFICSIRAPNPTLLKQEIYMQIRKFLGKINCILSYCAIDGFVESFDSVQISFMGHPLTTDIVPDNSPILQEEISGTDFLKDNAPTDIRFDMQGFVKWYGIIISSTRQNIILIPARIAKVFYIKIKNTEVKTGLIPFAFR